MLYALFLISLIFLPIACLLAQGIQYRSNNVSATGEWYFTNNPATVTGGFFDTAKAWLAQKRFQLTRYDSTMNDGTPNAQAGMAWMNSTGEIKRTPWANLLTSAAIVTALGFTPANAASSGTVTSIGITSADLSVSGSPITTSGNITANLTNTGVVAGTYDAVTVDSKGRVIAGLNWSSWVATGGRSFNTAYRESATNKYKISVSPQVSANLTLLAGQSGTITLQTSPNGTTGWVSLGVIAGSNTGALSIGINTTQITGAPMTYDIQAGYYYQMLTTNISNTPTFTFNLGAYSILQ